MSEEGASQGLDPVVWRRCNICKKGIPYRAIYWVCNVSTCNRKRTGLHFCTVTCWDAHLPMMNHRESWAVEHRAPSRQEWEQQLQEEAEPKTRKARSKSVTDEGASSTGASDKLAAQASPVIIRRRSSP